MVEIKFRAMAIETVLTTGGEKIVKGDFVYGSPLFTQSGRAFIIGPIRCVSVMLLDPEFYVEVDPGTVGQYAGLHDKNGVEIYGKDRVVCFSEDTYLPQKITGTVEYDKDLCAFVVVSRTAQTLLGHCWNIEVTDNPELLEV